MVGSAQRGARHRPSRLHGQHRHVAGSSVEERAPRCRRRLDVRARSAQEFEPGLGAGHRPARRDARAHHGGERAGDEHRGAPRRRHLLRHRSPSAGGRVAAPVSTPCSPTSSAPSSSCPSSRYVSLRPTSARTSIAGWCRSPSTASAPSARACARSALRPRSGSRSGHRDAQRRGARPGPPANYPDVLDGLALQFDGLKRMLGSKLGGRLQRRRPAQGAPGDELQGALRWRPRGERRLRRRGVQAQHGPLRQLRRRQLRHPRHNTTASTRRTSRSCSTWWPRWCAPSTRRRTPRAPGRSSPSTPTSWW